MDESLKNAFEELAEHLDYPMYIVTTAAGGARAGCLVGFCTQCSVDPVRYAVFLSDKNHTHAVALEASGLGVHVVPRDRKDLATLFGEETGDRMDKFERCRWTEGPLEVPLLEACGDRFVARILQRFSAGDHTGFIVEPVEAAAGGGRFFPFSAARQMDPGHEA